MTTLHRLVALAAVVACAVGTPALAEEAGTAVNARDLKWGPAPDAMPKGAKLAVLMGNPGESGPFVVRLSMPAGYKIPLHWHSQAEELTVISGTLRLSMGDDPHAHATAVGAGGFHYLPAKAHHAATTSGATIVQINGMGPFDINYVDSAAAAKAAAKQ